MLCAAHRRRLPGTAAKAVPEPKVPRPYPALRRATVSDAWPRADGGQTLLDAALARPAVWAPGRVVVGATVAGMADARHRAARRVAWVTGTSRGVGQGVAVVLGDAGWVVYATARSSAAGRTTRLPGTVEESAEAVSAARGHGVAVVCDHRNDAAVAAVAARITVEQGRLDLLVNNAWAGMSGWPRGRGRNGIPRCGCSRWCCSMRCSPAGCGRIMSRSHGVHRC
jgi:short chain dehydrogenase